MTPKNSALSKPLDSMVAQRPKPPTLIVKTTGLVAQRPHKLVRKLIFVSLYKVCAIVSLIHHKKRTHLKVCSLT